MSGYKKTVSFTGEVTDLVISDGFAAALKVTDGDSVYNLTLEDMLFNALGVHEGDTVEITLTIRKGD